MKKCTQQKFTKDVNASTLHYMSLYVATFLGQNSLVSLDKKEWEKSTEIRRRIPLQKLI